MRTLRSLELYRMNNLKKLPPGIACLTKLQYLKIENMEKLTALSEEICNLSLLYRLYIINCPKLAVLPQALLGLTSLQTLCIRRCPISKKDIRGPMAKTFTSFNIFLTLLSSEYLMNFLYGFQVVKVNFWTHLVH